MHDLICMRGAIAHHPPDHPSTLFKRSKVVGYFGLAIQSMAKPITDPSVLHACELLSSGVGPCVAKRMFGGWGISVDGMNIALIAWDTLYLKTNADTEPRWLAAGARPFVYEAKQKSMKLNYHTPPDEALESPGLMAPWARLALEAAVAARKPKARKTRL